MITGKQLVEKLYSEGWEIEQREYGLLSDITHSGLNRTYKKYIGRARRSIGNKLQRSISNDIERTRILAGSKETSPKVVLTRKTTRALTKEANSLGAKSTTIDLTSSPSTFPTGRQNAQDLTGAHYDGFLNNREYKKLMNANNSYKNIIVLPRKSGAESYAHEIGHLKNQKMRFPRIVQNIENKYGIRDDYNTSMMRDPGQGILKGIKNYFKGRVILAEEANASNNAMKLLKKSGVKEKDLRLARKNLDTDYQTYKAGTNYYYKTPIFNKIQIPSRRNFIYE